MPQPTSRTQAPLRGLTTAADDFGQNAPSRQEPPVVLVQLGHPVEDDTFHQIPRRPTAAGVTNTSTGKVLVNHSPLAFGQRRNLGDVSAARIHRRRQAQAGGAPAVVRTEEGIAPQSPTAFHRRPREERGRRDPARSSSASSTILDEICDQRRAGKSCSSTTAAPMRRSPRSPPPPCAMPRVRALSLSRNFGKEAALSAGLDHARGQCRRSDGRRHAGPARGPARNGRQVARGL